MIYYSTQIASVLCLQEERGTAGRMRSAPTALSYLFLYHPGIPMRVPQTHIKCSSGYLSPRLGADTAGTKLNRAKGSFFLSWKEFEWPLYANMLHMGKHIYVHETNVIKTVP